MPFDSAPATQGERISLPVILAFGAVGLPLAGLALVIGFYLPRFYVGLGIPFVIVGGAMGVVRLLDVGLDPLMALVMDRTRTPIGRYRPWLIAGLPLVMLGAYRLLNPNGHASASYLVLWLLVTYAGISMMGLAVAAWGTVLATAYNERSRLYGLTQSMALIGLTSFLLLPWITAGRITPGKAASMPTVGWILMVALPLAVAISALLTPERIVRPIMKSRFKLADYIGAIARPSMLRIMLADFFFTLGPGSVGPIYIFFFKDAKGFSVAEAGYLMLIGSVGSIIGAPVWARVARRFGKHRTIQMASVANVITQTILITVPRVWAHHTLIDALPTTIAITAVGFATSAYLPLVRAMVADVVDEVRLEQGQDLTSLLYSMVTTTQKVGAALSVAIIFPILGLFGYDGRETAVNTPHAIFGLEMCYLFAPVVLVIFGGFALLGYKLDDSRHAEIRGALDARDALAAASEGLNAGLTPAVDLELRPVQ